MFTWDNCIPRLSNCTFSQNSALNGTALACHDPQNWCPPSTLEVNNCILWDGGGKIWNNDGSTITINYSDVEGGWTGPGGNNISADPLFVGGVHLLPGSPCIDAGDNNSVPADITDLDGDANTTEPIPFDLDGRLRFADGDCNDTDITDMGTYEFSWIYIGDFASGCDVDFVDFAWFAPNWQDTNCGVCGGADFAGDGNVDWNDLKEFSDYWLLGAE